jgi:restriction endonuclease S subunit
VNYSIIKKSRLEGALRLDAEYYQPEYLELVDKIKKIRYEKLGNLCLKITDGSHITPEYQESGIPFLMVRDVSEQQINFDNDVSFITKKMDKKLKCCKPISGDILFTKVGSVGVSAVVPPDAPSFNIFVSVAALKECKGVDKYFLSTFLNSKFGRFQAVRSAKGISQPDLHLEDIREFLVPLFSQNQQQGVSKLVVEATNLFENSKLLYQQAKNLLLDELGLKDFKEDDEDLFSVVNLSDVKTANRIDAEYFQPKCGRLILKIKKQNVKLLSSVIENVPAKFDAAAQPDKNFKYVELADINASVGTIDGFSEVLGKEAPNRAKRVLKLGDVIVSSVEGSLGKVALVDKEQEGYLASTGFFQFRSKEILPEVLLVLARSLVFQMQLEKMCAGTILTAVPKEAVNNVVVPVLPKPIQQKIADLVRVSHSARKKAKELLEEAKRKVEEMIEK